MVKIRLGRFGSKGNVFYRIVVVEEKKKRSGGVLGVLGYWQPTTNLKSLKKDMVEFWIQRGACVSKAAQNVLKTK